MAIVDVALERHGVARDGHCHGRRRLRAVYLRHGVEVVVAARARDQAGDLPIVRGEPAREALVVVDMAGQHHIGPPPDLGEGAIERIVHWLRSAVVVVG